jgi:hypothetical protein
MKLRKGARTTRKNQKLIPAHEHSMADQHHPLSPPLAPVHHLNPHQRKEELEH